MMSATCPPPYSDVLSYVGITNCHIVHAATDRPEISYNVLLDRTLDESKISLVKILTKRMKQKENDPSFRGIVYCRSKNNVEELAKKIGCKPFHADRPEAERAETFKDWVDGKERVVVATSLLGCGIDVEGVGIVLHLGTPWSILDFVQESGRAGRGGRTSISMVFASKDEREVEGEGTYAPQLMREWVLQTTACRRTSLSAFLDGGHTTCTSLPRAALCDYCRREMGQEHPGKLIRYLAPTTLNDDVPAPRKPPHVPPTSSRRELDRDVPRR